MRILFFAHPSFFPSRDKKEETDRAGTVRWILKFAEELKKLGHDITLFQPEIHQVKKFELVHLFSQKETALWYGLKKEGLPIIITPSFSSDPVQQDHLQSHFGTTLIRAIRAIFQRKWPPLDECTLLGIADHYLVTSDHWKELLIKEWNVSSSKIQALSDDPSSAAFLANRIYRSMLTQ